MQARQKLLDLRSFKGDDGITRCDLILGPEVIETSPAPKRPFQGWRYLKDDEAPRDLGGGGGAARICLPICAGSWPSLACSDAQWI